jgi:hypothetical protein
MDCTVVNCDEFATHILSVEVKFANKDAMFHYPYCTGDIKTFRRSFKDKGMWTKVTRLPLTSDN